MAAGRAGVVGAAGGVAEADAAGRAGVCDAGGVDVAGRFAGDAGGVEGAAGALAEVGAAGLTGGAFAGAGGAAGFAGGDWAAGFLAGVCVGGGAVDAPLLLAGRGPDGFTVGPPVFFGVLGVVGRVGRVSVSAFSVVGSAGTVINVPQLEQRHTPPANPASSSRKVLQEGHSSSIVVSLGLAFFVPGFELGFIISVRCNRMRIHMKNRNTHYDVFSK